ncbi:hypothetical protein [Aureispira anguillae]|uniref:Uncharacterized protein n=1 Tax=Aureispira anguillae TaxID=2864201 RepID=A0A915YCG7_9BACT|nr:hypothetical protein [Aureispira anguillae]BDS10544.1 hypothetical protein AsAng_0012520 [Aureispira anguillae]
MNDLKGGFALDALIFLMVFGPFILLALLIAFVIYMLVSIKKSEEEEKD